MTFTSIIQNITPEGRELRESGVVSRSDYAKKEGVRGKWRKRKPGLRQKAENERGMA